MYVRFFIPPQQLEAELSTLFSGSPSVTTVLSGSRVESVNIGNLTFTRKAQDADHFDYYAYRKAGSLIFEAGGLSGVAPVGGLSADFDDLLTSDGVLASYSAADDRQSISLSELLIAGGSGTFEFRFDAGLDWLDITTTGSQDWLFSLIRHDERHAEINIQQLTYHLYDAELFCSGSTLAFLQPADGALLARSGRLGWLRDQDGNDLGAAEQWQWLGEADIQGDGDMEYLYLNAELGRLATVGVDRDGFVDFDNYAAGGETRVVGIYTDPLVASGLIPPASEYDSQARLSADLLAGNLTLLGGGDYDHDGLQELYFSVADGTYLHAYLHADGNIRYANYQNEQQMIEFLGQQGVTAETWLTWLE